MMMGMPYGFAELLQKKYAIMAQQADAQTTSANAGANLDNVKARLMPGQVEAEIGRTKAETTNLGLTGRTIVPLATAQIGLMGSQAKNYDAQSDLTGAETVLKKQLGRKLPFGLGFGGSGDNNYGFGGMGFKFSQ